MRALVELQRRRSVARPPSHGEEAEQQGLAAAAAAAAASSSSSSSGDGSKEPRLSMLDTLDDQGGAPLVTLNLGRLDTVLATAGLQLEGQSQDIDACKRQQADQAATLAAALERIARVEEQAAQQEQVMDAKVAAAEARFKAALQEDLSKRADEKIRAAESKIGELRGHLSSLTGGLTRRRRMCRVLETQSALETQQAAQAGGVERPADRARRDRRQAQWYRGKNGVPGADGGRGR